MCNESHITFVVVRYNKNKCLRLALWETSQSYEGKYWTHGEIHIGKMSADDILQSVKPNLHES